MKRVMHRLFWAWDFDREEDWLNAWAARGLALVDVCGIRYVFEEGAPGEYEYRLELLEHTAGSSEGRCYLDFLRDLDIECVGTYGRWAYLRRPRDGAPFDLFSDIDSKIAHLRRIEVYDQNEPMRVKIAKAQSQKIPYMVVLGDKEIENGTVSVRERHEGDLGAWPVEQLVEKLREAAL